ncbi:MAG: hypothetical protein UV43_C0033G0012 [Parcubacteria group bacterium GW2011_GWF2_42_7]|nr:MAG: hypothetical protein UU01_C0009G0007 [Parcubacteria group bacterium GW2011_GWA2_40_37]KKS11441.1 MAG: hypothetical protein UU66_C0017G0003 [Parcubacteria group bacterium GW2011_GWB1_41_5]KKS71562.1 MAG: hypothetical protein UV43_C0033G0012 [Parcubacteria group bacterium GW2011_GWF2_42_7]
MSYDEDEVESGFKVEDGEIDETLEEGEAGILKFEEETDEDPDDRYH